MTVRGEDAYCTLLTSDDYLPGAMVLAHSLRDAGTTKKIVIMVTSDTLSASTIDQLKRLYDDVVPVARVTNKLPANLFLMNRPDLHSTFTKINLWRLHQYRKIVYIDADVVALRAPDELFEVESTFAAAPDIGWPDCFNSGVLVLNPNLGDYYALLALAQRGISFDGADQGLLNMHFRDFHRLSFAYNCTPSGNYQYAPAYRHFQSSISMIHYIGTDKPWRQGRDLTGRAPVYEDLLGRWWAVYDRHYRAYSQQSGGTVQRYVKGEESHSKPEVFSTPTTIGRTETEASNKARQGQDDSKKETAVQEKATFSAPQALWNPSMTAPPANSRPEALNFPQSTYHMSKDTGLYKSSSAFPEPPRDLSYDLPKTPTGFRPPPIFPWEATAPKPTRVFDDLNASRTQSITSPSTATEDETQDSDTTPATPTIQVTSSEPWKTFTAVNAWDNMPEIGHYISNVVQHRRAKTSQETTSEEGEVISPTTGQRRPSMKLTDFPTEIERPSLPVTPAAVRRPSFWGAERDADGQLPAAEGVPRQEDWDPTVKLEELTQRQSAILPHIMTAMSASTEDAVPPTDPLTSPSTAREIPDRALPESAVPVPTSPPHRSSPTAVRRESSRRESGPPLGNPNFTPGGIGQGPLERTTIDTAPADAASARGAADVSS
ncbi:MAG: glycogenin glucosyltransferase [Caeruleum heppii]|nr:MAG: glycogenin glucosyltransferase [Caeruleum heppii]